MNTAARGRSLSPRGHRILAVVLLAGVVLIPLIALVVGAWFAHRYYDDVLAKHTRTLKTQNAVNATRPKLTEAVEALRAKDTKRFFLKAGSAGLVAAEFQESMRALVEANGGRVNQSQPLPAKDVDGYRQIAASFTISANQASLQKVLHAIEQKEPYVFVENLTLRSGGYGVRPAGQPEPEHYAQLDLMSFAPLVVDVVPALASTAPGASASNGKALAPVSPPNLLAPPSSVSAPAPSALPPSATSMPSKVPPAPSAAAPSSPVAPVPNPTPTPVPVPTKPTGGRS
jgi:general secretion pathway protein M